MIKGSRTLDITGINWYLPVQVGIFQVIGSDSLFISSMRETDNGIAKRHSTDKCRINCGRYEITGILKGSTLLFIYGSHFRVGDKVPPYINTVQNISVSLFIAIVSYECKSIICFG